jgi:hypothetical protein
VSLLEASILLRMLDNDGNNNNNDSDGWNIEIKKQTRKA